MAEDYLKFLTGQQGVQNPSDPLAFNPFAEGAAEGAGGATPFAEELPFRFTQFAINPSTKATAGQTGRAAVARSPFTSGQSARELAGIRSELSALGNPTNPGNPPDINTFYKEENFDPENPTGTSEMPNTPDLRWGMPITQLEIPRGLVLEGRSPIAMAYEWQKAKEGLTPEQLEKIGPMDTIEAYDMKAMLGEEEYAKWFGGQTYQGKDNQATQRFYQNLSVLPTNIDPQMSTDRSMANLAMRDFSYSGGIGREQAAAYYRGEADPDTYYAYGPPDREDAGFYGLDSSGNLLNPESIIAGNLMIDPTGQAPGSYSNFNWDNFNADVQNDLSQKINRSNPVQRLANQWTLPLIIAGMSYGTGAGLMGAAGLAGGGAAGATAGAGAVGANTAADLAAAGMISTAGTAGGAATATGLAGTLGMTAGIGASTVNTLSNMVATYGVSRAAEMAGIPMDNPLMIAAMAAAGGAYGAYTSGGPAPTGENQLVAPNADIGGTALTVPGPDQFMPQTYVDPVTGLEQTIMPGTQTGAELSSGVYSAGMISQPDLTPQQREWLQRQGMQGVQGLAGSMQDPVVTRDMLDPASQAEYDTALQQYESQVAAYERWNQLNALYEQRLNEFNAKQELYNKYRGLQGKQAGIMSDIQGNIASNPFYDPEENLTGIQSMFV